MDVDGRNEFFSYSFTFSLCLVFWFNSVMFNDNGYLPKSVALKKNTKKRKIPEIRWALTNTIKSTWEVCNSLIIIVNIATCHSNNLHTIKAINKSVDRELLRLWRSTMMLLMTLTIFFRFAHISMFNRPPQKKKRFLVILPTLLLIYWREDEILSFVS